MHQTTKDLQEFYDSQAEKFSHTRQRERPEFAYILAEVKKTIERLQVTAKNTLSPKSKDTDRSIRILELGCGDGRLLGYLQDNLEKDIDIDYVGVDISLKLLQLANKKYPHVRWIHQDMVYFLKNTLPEYFDVIIGVASFHHLPTKQERESALGFIYYTLQYEGAVIMTNRSYSDWFREKFKKPIQKALLKSLYTLGKTSKNDILVPWKDNGGSLIANRLYHIFGYKELEHIFRQSGFSYIEQYYIKNDGSKTDYEREGRNLFTVARKSIWK